MNILLKRIARKPNYTIGRLYIDGKYFCDTIEDKDRGLKQNMPLSEIKRKKIYSKTAIPEGTYTVTTSVVSPKMSQKKIYMDICKGKVPRLLNVPGYEGILIHIGNTERQSAGCILVGENKIVGQVINSTETFRKLFPVIDAGCKSGKVTITIQ